MAPTKPNYNSVLTRANQSRDKVLQDTGGLVEEPEVTEFNLADYGITFPSPEDYDRFARDFITKSGEKLTIKGPRPKSQQKLFNALNATGVSPQGSEQQAPLPRTKMSDEPIPLLQQGMLGEAPAPLDQEEALRKGYQYLTRDSRRVGDFSLFSTDNAPTPSFQPEMPEEAPLDMEAAAQPSEAQARLFQAIQETGKAPMTPLKPSPETAAGEGMTGLSPTQERLNALASILKMTEGDEAARRKAYERTAMDAETGKIMQAMMAGLTRSPVPANVYEPTPAYQPEGRLSLLAKAAQALRGVQDVTSAGSAGATGQKLASDSQKAWLKKYMPETYNALQESGTLDSATEAEWKSYVNLYAAKDKQGFQAQQNELNRLVKTNAQEQQARQAINSEVSKITKSPTVIRLTSTIPVLKGMLENDVFNKIESGSEVLNKIGLGQATPQEEQLFNAFFERLTAADRQQLFGATLTGNELASYNTMVGAGKNASTSTKLKLFSNFVKSLKQGLQVQFAPFFIGQDAPDYAYRQQVYENFKTASNNATAENPIFDIVEQAASQRASELPQTMEEEARAVGERVRGAGGQALKSAKGLLGGQAPSTAPVVEDRIPPMPSQTNKGIGQNEIVIYKKGQKPLIIPKSDYAAAKKDGWSLTPGDAQ